MDVEEFYDRYDIQREYRHPNAYDTSGDSWKAKYPPDWEDRKLAVADMYGGICSRCQRDITELDCPPNAHHLTPLREGGTNELDNLILLCGHCHAALEAADIDSGTALNAPVFPHLKADNRVAFVRELAPEDADEFERPISVVRYLLEMLNEHSEVGVNQYACEYTPYELAPRDAKEAQSRLYEMVKVRSEVRIDENLLSIRHAHQKFADIVDRSTQIADAIGSVCHRCEDNYISDGFCGVPVEPNKEIRPLIPGRPEHNEGDVAYLPICDDCAIDLYRGGVAKNKFKPFGARDSLTLFDDLTQLPSALNITVTRMDPANYEVTIRVVDGQDNPVPGVTVQLSDKLTFSAQQTNEAGETTISTKSGMKCKVVAKVSKPKFKGEEEIQTSVQISTDVPSVNPGLTGIDDPAVESTPEWDSGYN